MEYVVGIVGIGALLVCGYAVKELSRSADKQAITAKVVGETIAKALGHWQEQPRFRQLPELPGDEGPIFTPMDVDPWMVQDNGQLPTELQEVSDEFDRDA